MIRLIEGFDACTDVTRYLGKWTGFGSAATLSASAGRFGSGCIALTSASGGSFFRTFDAQPVWIVGFAFQFTGSSNTDILSLEDGTVPQVSIDKDTGGALRIHRGTSTLLATSAAALSANTWHFVEVKALIADAGGYVTVRVNGAEFVSVTNADTKYSSSNAWASVVKFHQTGANNINRIDDIYILDGTGSPNDFLGDHRVRTLAPAADEVVQFARSTGAYNYANVDDASPDDDGTYNESDVVGARDLLAFNDLPANPGTIQCVQVSARARKDDAGARSLRIVAKSGAADVVGASNALGTNYQYLTDVFATDPATGVAWTEAGVNAAASFGYEVGP